MDIIKVRCWNGYVFRSIKLTTPTANNIIEVSGYRSRSGLHWDIGFLAKNNEIKEVRGIFKKLDLVAEFSPMAEEDLYKQIPREGKNIVHCDVKAFYDFHIEAFERITKMLPNETLLLKTTHNGFAIYLVKDADATLYAREIANQANLLVYEVIPESIPKYFEKWIEEIKETTRAITLGGHTITLVSQYDFEGLKVLAKRVTRAVEAILVDVLASPSSKLLLLHPEHDTIEISTPPRLLLFLHSRGRIID